MTLSQQCVLRTCQFCTWDLCTHSCHTELRELMSHLMVEHRLDVGKLPHPTVEELQDIHRRQPHHTHDDMPARIRELEAQVALLEKMAYLRIPIPRLRKAT